MDTHFVRKGIIIRKWRNKYKKQLRISGTHFVCNGIIITKWRKRVQEGTTEFQTPNMSVMEYSDMAK